jgi:hypothetical protein
LLGFEGLTDLEDLILRHPQQPVAELVHRQLRDNGVKVLKGGGSPLWQALPMHFYETSKEQVERLLRVNFWLNKL